MCRKVIYLISSVLVLSSAFSNIAGGADPNFVGWWKLNETSGSTAYDSSGNNYNGALYGNPQWVPGHINGTLQFDGSGDYVSCGNPALLTIRDRITLACWVRVTTFTQPWQAFVVKGDNAYRISRSQSGGTCHMGMSGTKLGYFDGTTRVDGGEWHHVAGVYDGAQAILYIDGHLDIAKPNTGRINAVSSNVYIGANQDQMARTFNGTMDDVRIYNRALKPTEIPIIMYGESYPFAYDPDPADKAAVSVSMITLGWQPGGSVAAVNGHKVYLDSNQQKVISRSGCQINGVSTTNPSYPIPAPLALGKTYYWVVDEVNETNIWPGTVWSFSVVTNTATNPVPSNNAELVDPNVTLEWVAGVGAIQHHVYYGTNLANVNAGTGGTDKGTVTEPNFYTGVLEFGKTYYWRIDEVTATTTYTGDTWRFTTVGPLVGLKGEYYNNVDLSGQPVLTRKDYNVNFDWGIDTPDPLVNVDNFSARWSGVLHVPATGTYTFSIYCLSEDGIRLWVNGSLIIDNWPASDPAGFEAAIDLAAGQASIVMEFFETQWGAVAKLSWQSSSIPRQIIPVGTFTLPFAASSPTPSYGATGIKQTPTLQWTKGDKAAQHDVYFGTSFEDVNIATTSSTGIYSGRQILAKTRYTPTESPLIWGKTYYWRIDEVNGVDVWKGDVWNFTVADYLIVDDFEDYNNFTPDRVFQTWLDGIGYSAEPPYFPTAYPGNGTGAAVGHDIWTTGTPYTNIIETTIIHSGMQSMPVDYNNTRSPYYSEAQRVWTTGQDWTGNGVRALTLWFRGIRDSVGSLNYDQATSTYSIAASGADIWDTADEFHFAYKTFTGDGSIIARIDSIENTNSSAKVGVMIRETLNPGSALVDAVITQDGRVALQYRTSADVDMGNPDASTQTAAGAVTLPRWVKLTRLGSVFTVQHSADGVTWVDITAETEGEVGRTTVAMGQTVYIGLAVTAHNTTSVCHSKISNVTINGTYAPTGPFTVSQDIGIATNDAAPLYVTLEDDIGGKKTVTHTNTNAVLQNTWQEWNISLSNFTGVKLDKIKKMTIGVGDKTPGGTGSLYFDDIRLYPPRCLPSLAKSAANISDDCLVGYADLDTMANDWLLADEVIATTPPGAAGLVGHWTFDGNANDSSGSSNNGLVNGSPSWVSSGQIGGALSLDGVNDCVQITRTVQDDFTLAAWIKTDQPGAAAGTAAWQGSGLIWSDVVGGDNDFIFAVLGKKLIFATGPVDTGTTSKMDVVTGQWVHVAVTRTASSGDVTLFIKGGVDTTQTHPNTGSLTANPLIMIGANTYDAYFYAGLIDDVRIYNRALSAAEIAYLADTTPGDGQLYVPVLSLAELYSAEPAGSKKINFNDFAVLVSSWLEEKLWP